MNKVIKHGMVFNENGIPDFGNITSKTINPNILYLLAEDIPKLNSMMTRAAVQSYLPERQSFNFYTGALAFIVDYKTADSGKIYVYHRGNDHWYEFNIRSDLGLFDFMWNRHARILRETKEISDTAPLTFKSNGRPLKNYRIYGNTVNGESVGDLVTEGEHAGKYCVPLTTTNGKDTITTNIYLPEPIKTVGDDVEYIDYIEQKKYRSRKNIFSGFIYGIRLNTGNGIEENSNNSYTTDYIPVEANMLYTYSGGSNSIPVALFAYDSSKNYIGRTTNTARTTDTILMSTDVSGQYTTFRSNLSGNTNPVKYIRVTHVIADATLVNAENIMLNFGPTVLSYEPYIENTELNITLPELPTLSGTNTLSIGTTIQPSSVVLKGRIKKVTV